VVQRGCGSSFQLEAAESLGVVGKIIGEELQSNVATQLQVFGLVHDTHAAAADLVEDTVMGNRLPHGLGRHVSSHGVAVRCNVISLSVPFDGRGYSSGDAIRVFPTPGAVSGAESMSAQPSGGKSRGGMMTESQTLLGCLNGSRPL